MLHPAKDLTGFSVRATDGAAGEVQDVLFDDERWTVRYLVVDTGTWLPGRQVLISPFAIGRLSVDDEALNVALTRAEIERSPDVNVHQPISRRFEEAYARYYGYPYYWGGAGVWGTATYPFAPQGHAPARRPADDVDPFVEAGLPPVVDLPAEDVHLRSYNSIRGYTIDATDGEIGHVEDLLIADDTWSIQFIVVATSNWWFGKKVVILPSDVEGVSWADAKAVVALSRESLKESPAYDHDALIAAGAQGRASDRIRPI